MNKILLRFLIAASTILMWQTAGQADPAPTTRPVDSSAPIIGDMRTQSLQGYTYAYVSATTSMAKLVETINALLPRIDAAIDAGNLRPTGPFVFTYHITGMDQSKPFTLDVGVIVKDGNRKPEGIQVVAVPAQNCATILFSGAVAKIAPAYDKLFTEIGRRGLQPTGLTREVYLYWEDPESANNIVQVQAELSPTN